MTRVNLPTSPAWPRPPSRPLPRSRLRHQSGKLLPLVTRDRGRVTTSLSRLMNREVRQHGRDQANNNIVIRHKPLWVEANITDNSSNLQMWWGARPRPGLPLKPDLSQDSSSELGLRRRRGSPKKWPTYILAQTCFLRRSVSIRSSVNFRGKVAKTAS